MIYGLVAQLMGRIPLQNDPPAGTGPNQLPSAQGHYYSIYFSVLFHHWFGMLTKTFIGDSKRMARK